MTENLAYPILGIDIGATGVKFGALQSGGKLTLTAAERVHSENNDALLEQLIGIISLPQFQNCSRVGIGSPGPLDLEHGIILASANMPAIRNLALIAGLRERFPDREFLLDNDANAATLGEYFFGAAKNGENLGVFTLGTGVGGGCILRGRLQRGIQGNFFEVGHMPVAAFPENNPLARVCGCGATGCLETIASATGISETYRQLTQKQLTAAEIFRLAIANEEQAIRAYRIAGEALGIAAASLTQILNLTEFVVTGGVAAAASLLQPWMEQTWTRHTFALFHPMLQLRFTEPGDDAGIRGAAALFLEEK